MTNQLRILHLEDEPEFAEVVRHLLDRDGLEAHITVVSCRADFQKELSSNTFHLILADFALQDYSALEAVTFARHAGVQVPFIVVSGNIGEEAAVQCMHRGATDYVLKPFIEKLCPAIRRAMSEYAEKIRRRNAELELMRRNQCFRMFTENSLDITCVINTDGYILYNSQSVQRVLGYDVTDLAGTYAFELVHPDDLQAAQLAFRQTVEVPTEVVTAQFRFRHKDGSWRYLEAVGKSMLEDPSLSAVIMNLRDITDRKLADRALLQSEMQYRLIFDGNPTAMFIFENDTLRFVEVNDSALKLYRYSREEFLRLKVSDIRLEGDQEAMIEYWHRIHTETRGESHCTGVWKHQCKDGSLIDVEVKWCQIDFKGKPASIGMVQDITQRKLAEHRGAALSKLGQSLSGATTPGEAADIIRSVADDLFAWNAFVLDLYAPELDVVFPILNIDTDRLGRRFHVAQETSHTPSEMARQVIESGAKLILREGKSSGTELCWRMGDTSRPSASLLFAPVRNRTKVIGILSIQSYETHAYTEQDLATLQTLADHCGGALERISAEHALHESELRFRELFESSPDAIFVEDTHGRVLDVNPAACQLHGLPRESLVGRHVSELVPPENAEKVHRLFDNIVSGRLRHFESYSLAADGRQIPVEIRANPIQYCGNPAVLLHVCDITQRRRAEDALRSSEMLFHSVWDNSVDGMRLTDEDGNIVAVNAAYCRLVSKSREELEGQPFSIVYADSENPAALVPDYKNRFGARIIERQAERRLVLHNGTVLELEFTSSFVDVDQQAPLLLTLFRDVTAQKRLEDQLRQSQKMEAIGQLAGGVAHDFNNILTVIHGHASLMMATETTGHVARSAQQIVQAAERAASLTRQLLAFGRRQVMQSRRLDLNEVVRNMTRMLARLVGEDINLTLSYSKRPACIHADAGMIEQVLLNLVVNSRDAMPRGGVLNVRISSVNVDSAQTTSHADARPGPHICLTTEDTGCGINPEVLPHIFEPFFTTKEVGKGTGLGLATVYGIVKQHHGWIEVDSKPGRGSIFRVYIPSCETLSGIEEKPEQGRLVRGGSETILVVEDESLVRELVCTLLSAQGYKILEAESGVKALQVWEKSKHDIDLLLTDLVMPDRLNGRELAEKLLAERPDLKVIFTSGYSADVVGSDFVMNQGLTYLQKPYHPDRLAGAVRDCLDAIN